MLSWETFMPEGYEWLIFIARIVLAIVLGFAIGFERKMRIKEAGVRTHSMVALGACLFMLISKYGFSDIPGNYDAARIAAQVISGIGFIGAGIIMYRKQAVHGLTSAACVWVTAGIGMAAGGGMYILAVAATAIAIAAQCILHINCSLFQVKRYVQMRVIFGGGEENIETVKNIFGITTSSNVSARTVDGEILFTIIVRTDKIYDATAIYNIMQANPFIQRIERVDEDE